MSIFNDHNNEYIAKQDIIETRIERLVQDIRFAKELMWKNLYYALLFYGGVIALSFKLSTHVNYHFILNTKEVFMIIIVILGSIIIISATIFLCKYQNSHKNAIKKYRINIKIYQEYSIINSNTIKALVKRGIREQNNEPFSKYLMNNVEDTNRELMLYNVPFIAAIIISGLFSIGVILLLFIL